jgi:methionyl-tRNA synthetase
VVGRRIEPRAVTRDLDWGIDVPVEGAEGKNYMCGLMRQLVTFRQLKNGQLAKEKIGNRIGKMKIPNWFTLLGKTISFFTV